MSSFSVGEIPLNGGQNTSADEATQATTLVSNIAIGPAGENYQRDGLVDTHTTGLGTSPVIGVYPWREWVIIVTQDRKVWAMPKGSPYTTVPLSDGTAGTQLLGSARPVFAEDGLPRVVIAGGNAIQQWTGTGLTSVLVTAGHSPAATHVAYLGQRLIANDISNPTQWYWSDLGDGSHQSWTASNFTTADASPDAIAGVYATLREAYVFGERTLQVYGVGQDPLNPFDNLNTLQIGCSAPYSPLNFDGTWMWLDDKRRIVASDGRSFEDIGKDLSKTLRGFTTVSDVWSYREDVNTEINAVFVFPTEGREFVYDIDVKGWSERSYFSPSGQTRRPINCFTRWDAFNNHLLGSSTTGALYTLGDDVTTDLGQPLVMERITGWLDHGTRSRKRSIRVRFVIERGTRTSGASDNLEVRVADDGGNWGEWELLPVGLSGDSVQVVDAYFGGVFRRRKYDFRYSGTQEMALLSAEEHFLEVGN